MTVVVDSPDAATPKLSAVMLPPTDRTLELRPIQNHGNSKSLENFQLRRQISSNRFGVCYEAIDLSTNELVELRRLDDSLLPPDLKVQIGRCLKLFQLQKHPGFRVIRWISTESGTTELVIDSFGDRTFQDWVETQHPPALRLLETLVQIGTVVVIAHRFGLVHGNLNGRSIGWSDRTCCPQLDFSGTEILHHDHSVLPEQDPAIDTLGFAQLMHSLLQNPRFAAELKQLSAAETARLRNLTRLAESTTSTEPPELNDFVNTLQALFLASLNNGHELNQHDSYPEDQTCESSVVVPSPGDTSMLPTLVPFEQESERTESSSNAADDLPRELQVGSRLGRFVIEQKLGEGGMGSVFRARDISDSTIAAIKVLSPSAVTRKNSLRRFRKEARLLASLNNPWITNLIEVNEDKGIWYIVLEYVDGTDLKTVLTDRRVLPEKLALSIVADVARGLVDAHQRDIVHRDIKPENILLEGYQRETELSHQTLRVRLADFGIARHVEQSESMDMTQSGGLLGTPLYMSPEQFRDASSISPQSDIYSLGITLFELLTGRTPFVAPDAMALAGKHCFETPPSVQRVNPEVSEAAARIVQKCLAKPVSERYADAAHLLREIDLHLRGQPSAAALHPVLPDCSTGKVVASRMSWDLASTPEELWPFVVNTDRLNRAIGLPPVKYSTFVHPRNGVQRFGSISLAGFVMTWEEHPFEWIEGRRMSVLRQFGSGPFEWFVSTVELERLPEGNTRLYHEVKIAPRNWLGRQLAKIETGTKCRRSLHRVYTRIDQTLSERRDGRLQADPFESPQPLKRFQRLRISERAERLTASGVAPDLTAALAEFLTNAAPQDVSRIRPMELAVRLGYDESQVLDACLLASMEGLLQLLWDLLCPACRVTADTRDTLRQLASHGHCAACDQSFALDAADAVEMIFRIHPDLRDSQTGTYCIGGPGHSPHVVAQIRLEPKERMELDLALSTGDYLIRGPRLPVSTALRVQSAGAPSQLQILLDSSGRDNSVAVLREGRQLVLLENTFDVQQLVRIERTIPRSHVVTAAQAAALPRFRELFPGEVLKSGRMISADNVTFLVTTVPLIDDIYAQQGDAAAFACIEKQSALLRKLITDHRGEVVKVIGERTVACFEHVVDAVQAAFEMQAVLCSEPLTSELQLAIGVHRGPAIVSTVNGRLDYFGLTMRQALVLPDVSGPGVSVTEAIFADPEVHEYLSNCGIPSRMHSIALPGKAQQIVQRYPQKA